MKPGNGKIQVGTLLTESIYLQIKAQAALEKRRVGSLIDEAMQLYLKKMKKGA